MKKYELTNDTITHNGRTLHRIKALRDIPLYDVKAGDLGGYAQSEYNLSHDDNCWVAGNAKVYDNAWIYGDAWVSGDAQVFGSSRVYEYTKVCGKAKVCGYARVYNNAIVFGDAWVSGYARVGGNTYLDSGLHTGTQTEHKEKHTKQKDVFTSLTHGIVKNTDEGWQNLPDDKAYPILLTKTDGSNPVVVEQRYMLQWVYECGHKEPINEGDKWYSLEYANNVLL